jgi:hypothetical protein
VDKNNNIPNSFDLPEGYFKNSKAGILNKIEWMQEHEAYPFLAKLDKASGFIVPENYFSENVSKLELLDTPVLNSYKKEIAFEIPQNYFEENKARLISIVADDDMSAYPTLSSIEKKNPFATKEDYFETSKRTMLGNNRNEGGATILSLFTKPVRYAAAAVLMITIGLWIYNSYVRTEITTDECTTLACLEKKEIMKFKFENIDMDELNDAAVDLNKLEKNLKEEKTDTTTTADSTDDALLDLIE